MLNSSPTVKYRPLTVSGPPPPTLAKPAGIWKRLHILKVILVVGFLLTILNLFNYGFDKKFEKLSFLRNSNNITQQLQNPLHTTSRQVIYHMLCRYVCSLWNNTSVSYTQTYIYAYIICNCRAISPSAFNNFGPKRLRPNVENDLIRPEPAKEDGLVLRNDRSNATRTIIPTISGSRVFKNSFKNSTFTTESSSTQDHSQTDLQEQPLAIIKSVPNEVQVASSTPSRPPSPLVPQTEKRTLQENSVVDLKDHLILSQSQQRPTIPSILKLGAPNSINQEEEKERLRTKTDPYLVLNATARTKFSGYIQTTSAQSVTFLSKLMTKLGINACPECPPDLHGPLEVNLTKDTVAAVETHLRRFLLPGGWYRPPECNAKDRVAIIIPFRDREEHLPILLKNLHPMLMRQQVNYGIFVVEETMADPFNRASLMNIGFLEASKMHNWDCFIFHDVDLIPLDDRNLYRCPEQPRHMSVAIDVFDYK